MTTLAEDFDRTVAWDAIGIKEIAAAEDHTEGVTELTPGGHRTTGCWPVGVLLHRRWRNKVASWGLSRDRVATLLLALRTGPDLGDSTWAQVTTAHVPSTVSHDPEEVDSATGHCGRRTRKTDDTLPRCRRQCRLDATIIARQRRRKRRRRRDTPDDGSRDKSHETR